MKNESKKLQESEAALSGVIVDGRVYVAVAADEPSCVSCDLVDDRGMCVCADFCFEQGRNNIFRYSQSLTDKLNGK